VSGWGQHLDDLSGSVTQLLHDGAVHPVRLIDPSSTLAARDAVLVQLRELIGAVADVPTVAAVRELTLHDAVHRPAQALHQSLSELPRAIDFGEVELAAKLDAMLPVYEQAWQRAARSTIALEGYVDALRQLPDHVAWAVLRDLADLAAALPYLDHDLSEAVLPLLKGGDDLAVPYRMLTHPGHAVLRTISAEVRARVPVVEPAGRGSTHLPAPDQRSTHPAVSARGHDRGRERGSAALHGPAAGELAEAMVRYAHAVSSCGTNLSVADLRAVARLLETGSVHAGLLLDRTGSNLEGAADAAASLHVVASRAQDVRKAPVKAIPQPHLALVRTSTELQSRIKALAEQGVRGRAAPQDLRRLACHALEYAQHAPALAGALDQSVREAVAHGLMLVPGSLDRRSDLPISWVTARMGAPSREGPPEVVARAAELSTAARQAAPALRRVGQDLHRHADAGRSQSQEAAQAARRHAGAARTDLRTALAGRIAAHPAVLAPELSVHPRLAPPPRAAGRR
jgi:hypothetical protein